MGTSGAVFEGKTLDDAVRKGLETLGLSRAEVMITMIEEGSGGFLGLGARPYKVRIMPRPGGPPREPEDRRERRGRRAVGRGRRAVGGGRGRRGAERSSGRNGDGRREAGRRAATAASGEEESKPRRRGRRGGRSRRGERGAPREHDRSERPESSARPPREGAPAKARTRTEPAIGTDELADLGKRWTQDMLKAMGFDATVSATAEEDRVSVTAEVPEQDELLTGRKGEVRQALQHLLNRMINRGEGTRYHLQLEINDFWQQREDELREVAKDLAEEALESNGEAVTEYLNAQERRIIHVTLRDDQRVKTYALGTGLIKRVAVAPADYPGGEDAEG